MIGNQGNTNVNTQCPQGQRWDAWKGMCVPMSPLADGLGGGQTTLPAPTTATTPTTPTPVVPTFDVDAPLGGPPPGGEVDLPQDPESGTLETVPGEERTADDDWPSGLPEYLHGCESNERWMEGVGCVPYQSGTGDPQGFIPQIMEWIGQGITDITTFFACPWWAGEIWDPQTGECIDASTYEGPTPLPDPEANDPSNWTVEERYVHDQCIKQGYAGWDKATQACIPKPAPSGQYWDEATRSYLDICPEGSYWDAITASCKQGVNPNPQDIQSNYDAYGNIIDPNQQLTSQDPYDFMKQSGYDMAQILGVGGEEAAEERYWQAKMGRYNEQYEKSKGQLKEDLNVKGLYYSGVKGDKLEELEEQKLRDVEHMTAEFQHEAFQREIQRKQQGIEYALGSQALNMQYELGQGKLTLEQLHLAMEENLGLGALDIQQQGLDLQVIQHMASISMAEAQAESQRQNIWLNVVAMLHSMGLSEEEVQNMWGEIAGQNRAPAF